MKCSLSSSSSLCFFAIFSLAYCYDFHDERSLRIAGGVVTSIDRVPYIAQIIDEDDEFCGASIISNYWLVTAAHCFSGRSEAEKQTFKIVTGSSLSFVGEQHEIQRIITHPGYSRDNQYDNDIALILLKKPIVFNRNQRPISLATTAPKIGNIMTVSGYGWEEERRRRRKRQYEQRRLKALTIKVIEQKDCAKKYEELWVRVTLNSFCATSARIDSTCIRDSGGPGVIDGKLAGIVSGGYRCKANEYPNVYTRVHRYVDWIRLVTTTAAGPY